VSLFEKNRELGGQLLLAAATPGKYELGTTLHYFKTQLAECGAQVETGRTLSAAEIIAMDPDAVILATGSTTASPAIPGSELPHVALARDVISGAAKTGDRVIVAGGGLVGCETAMLLSEQGKEVTLVRISGKGRLAGELGPASRASFLIKLAGSGVKVLANAAVISINAQGAVITKDDSSVQLEADTIVLSPRPEPDESLLEELKEKIRQVEVIGDCAGPRGILEAVHEGYAAAGRIK